MVAEVDAVEDKEDEARHMVRVTSSSIAEVLPRKTLLENIWILQREVNCLASTMLVFLGWQLEKARDINCTMHSLELKQTKTLIFTF